MAVSVRVVCPSFPGRKSRRRDHAESPHAQRAVDQDVSGGDNFNGRDRRIAESANRFAAVVLFDLLDGQIEVLCPHRGGLFINGGRRVFSLRHILEELSGIERNDKSGTKTNARREGGRCTVPI